MQTIAKLPFLMREEIFLEELEFITENEVSVIGWLDFKGKLERAQFILDKKGLYKLLMNAGKLGNQLTYLIVQKFRHPHEVPVLIDIADVLGKPLCINSCKLKLDRSYYKNEAGDWTIDYKTNLFFIEEIQPLEKELKGLFRDAKA